MTAHASSSPKKELPSLTGLRFWAAFSIMLNHLLLGFVARDDAMLAPFLQASGLLGMDAFFILSGFIIHYNYSQRLSDFSVTSYRHFLGARIARLYPLYTALLTIDFLTQDSLSWQMASSVLAFFLTMTQSWFYLHAPDGTIVPHVLARSSIAWSISTEFLMYCFYPALLWLMLKLRFPLKWSLPTIVLSCMGLSLFMGYVLRHAGEIDQWAVRFFGPQAGSASGSNSFVFWLTFISPYFRFFEFIIGALVAEAHDRLANHEAGRLEQLLASAIGIVSLLVILASFLPVQQRIPTMDRLHEVTGYYPFIALIIFVCARYPFAVTARIFGAGFLVFLGECSYSIYLFHIYIYSAVQRTDVTLLQPLKVLVLWGSVFVCAYVLYVVIERPGRRLFRRLLT